MYACNNIIGQILLQAYIYSESFLYFVSLFLSLSLIYIKRNSLTFYFERYVLIRTRTLATEGVALRLGFGKQRVAVVAHSSREPESVGGGGGNTLAEL